MSVLEILYQGLLSSFISIGKLSLIILPLMVIIEWAKQRDWLETISNQAQYFTTIFHLPSTTALPALIGLFIGIISGSGIILQTAKEENLSRLELTVLFTLIGICHSLFEETAVFIGCGANILIIASTRLIVAFLLAYLLGLLLKRNNSQIEFRNLKT